MVGHRPLKASILVRVQVPQLTNEGEEVLRPAGRMCQGWKYRGDLWGHNNIKLIISKF